MEKLRNYAGVVALTLVLLTGCQAESETSESQEEGSQSSQEIEATVELTKNQGEEQVEEKDITVEEGTVLMDAMEENFEVEEKDGFINGIEGISAEEGEKKAWVYDVNGEEATVGAAEYEIEDGDEIHFDFQSWE
ncbi:MULTISPECIES: DUF4430 domain-containing protein [Salimicrobium]|uniref:Transcobalamin-like C-terminal domain-containing protein n=1 Tax=Salimicrobium humidisoli TaxID=2029857 RepID=A0ABX4HQM9_9BACI|nr:MULTISPECIES: DUF4430 domain-containing protein [Salimicrobium]PBB05489.1 hypothetical protein CKW00_08845 [Salimicrobium humidisoli]